jgi:hypothetical protein
MADRIPVFDSGELVEIGSRRTRSSRRRYAELFGLQAASYR